MIIRVYLKKIVPYVLRLYLWRRSNQQKQSVAFFCVPAIVEVYKSDRQSVEKVSMVKLPRVPKRLIFYTAEHPLILNARGWVRYIPLSTAVDLYYPTQLKNTQLTTFYLIDMTKCQLQITILPNTKKIFHIISTTVDKTFSGLNNIDFTQNINCIFLHLQLKFRICYLNNFNTGTKMAKRI